MQKYFGSSLHSYIVATRYMEGHQSVGTVTEEQRQDMIIRWEKTQAKERSDFVEKLKTVADRRHGSFNTFHSRSSSSISLHSAAHDSDEHPSLRGKSETAYQQQLRPLSCQPPPPPANVYELPSSPAAAAHAPVPDQLAGIAELPAELPIELPAELPAEPDFSRPVNHDTNPNININTNHTNPAAAAADDEEDEAMIRRAIAESIESERQRAAKFGVMPQV